MRFILSLLLFLIFTTGIFSQNSTIYKGTVKDSITQVHIPYATIALFNNNDLIDGVSTNDTGQFTLKSSKSATYISVSFIGYKTYTISINEINNMS